jgi:hypothetical protein
VVVVLIHFLFRLISAPGLGCMASNFLVFYMMPTTGPPALR